MDRIIRINKYQKKILARWGKKNKKEENMVVWREKNQYNPG
jgi:hypothetical protein